MTVDSLSVRPDLLDLITELLLAMACSDDGVMSNEIARIGCEMSVHFDLTPQESQRMIKRASQRLSAEQNLDGILHTLNGELDLPQKQLVMLLLLKVVASDGLQDVREMRLLQYAAQQLAVSDTVMNKVFEIYRSEKV